MVRSTDRMQRLVCGGPSGMNDTQSIGRDALEKRADAPHRHKRTLRWSKDDVVRIFASQLGDVERHKFMDMPASHYATCPYDDVQIDGQSVGISHYPVYTSNVRGWISLALLDESAAEPGTEVSLTWGEPDGGTEILISEAYRWAFTRGHRYGYASAYAVLIFFVLLAWSRIGNRISGQQVL